jgi:sugar phosphate isomerase/epimerase
MQLDTGALTINGEDIGHVIKDYAPLIGHIHASEPDLVTLGDGGADHATVGLQLNEQLPELIVTIEMLLAKNGSNLDAIERALGIAIRYYRGSSGAVTEAVL